MNRRLPGWRRWWPRSLFGRLALILFGGLAAAHVLSFWLILAERIDTARGMLANYLPRDIAASVAILERVPAAERAGWLNRIERRNYRYVLGAAPEAGSRDVPLPELAVPIGRALGAGYTLTATVPPRADDSAWRLHLRLQDGTPLTIEQLPQRMGVSATVSLVLLAQLIILVAFTWIAVRLATRPLAQLARAADALGPELKGAPLPEDGPSEVARAAEAFNAMQRRIADHLAERFQILAAVSHDLQTPLTRMRLRADLLDSAELREKLRSDLDAMQALVEEGIAYARSARGMAEPPRRIDLHAFLDSLVCDYTDAGRPIRLAGKVEGALTTRPHALRRVLINLVDNALKFGGGAEIRVGADSPGRVAICVCDRGPGVPAAELQAVLQPFYRVEGSRSRETGGTGLGLAIAQQLTTALGGTLALSNRPGGGLEARLSLPDLG